MTRTRSLSWMSAESEKRVVIRLMSSQTRLVEERVQCVERGGAMVSWGVLTEA